MSGIASLDGEGNLGQVDEGSQILNQNLKNTSE